MITFFKLNFFLSFDDINEELEYPLSCDIINKTNIAFNLKKKKNPNVVGQTSKNKVPIKNQQNLTDRKDAVYLLSSDSDYSKIILKKKVSSKSRNNLPIKSHYNLRSKSN